MDHRRKDSHSRQWSHFANSEAAEAAIESKTTANKTSLLTPDPPPVSAAMTATPSIPCSTLAPGQA